MQEQLRILASQIIADRSAAEGLQRFIYEGQCMYPVLEDGDLVFVKSISPEKLHLGDIVVLKNGKHPYIHRYLHTHRSRSGQYQIITKADRYLRTDKPAFFQEFIGKVVRIKANCRQISLEKAPFKIVSFLIGLASLLEASMIDFLKRLHPKSLEINKSTKRQTQKWVQAPKSLLEKMFGWLQ